LEYSVPYIVVLLTLGLCALLYETLNGEKEKSYVNYFAILVFFVFFGFRGYVFTDWTTYVETIANVGWGDIFEIVSYKDDSVIQEPGFTLLCCLCSLVSRELWFLVAVVTAVDLLLFLRFLRRWEIDNHGFVWILFIAYEGLNIMFNLMRNQIAILIFLNALEYLEKRKPLQYFSLCFASLCFHMSSVLFFPLYFFLHRRLNRWVFLSAYFALLAFYLSKASAVSIILGALGLEGTLAAKVKLYTELYTATRELPIVGTFFAMILIALVTVYYDRLTTGFKFRVMAVNSLLLYFVFFYVFAEFKELSSRMSYLFLFPFWTLWIDLGKCLTIKTNRILLYSAVYIFALYTTAFSMKIPAQQYDNLLFGAKSQQERLRILNKTYEPEE